MGNLDSIKDMAEVGFIVISAGLIIILFLRMSRSQQKSLDLYKQQYSKFLREERQNNQKLMEEIINKCRSKTYMVKEDQVGEAILGRVNDLISEMRTNIGAGRGLYIAYHDGTRDLIGSHFEQMSCRAESVSTGVKPSQLQFQSIPRSFLINWCNGIREKKKEVLVIKDIKDVKEKDYVLYDYHRSKNTNAVLGKALLDVEGNVRGFIMMEFLTPIIDGEVVEKAKREILEKTTKIEEQLIILDMEQTERRDYYGY